MEYEIACGLYVREKSGIKLVKLRPKKTQYKFSEEITVPAIKKTLTLTEDLIDQKLKQCKAICARSRPYSIPALYTHNKNMLRSLTAETSYRTNNIVNSLDNVTKAFQVLTS